MKRCHVECQNRCQIECQPICQNVCQNRCQIEYQIECQIECQNTYIYIFHIYFQMVCQKLCQNSVSGWGSLDESQSPQSPQCCRHSPTFVGYIPIFDDKYHNIPRMDRFCLQNLSDYSSLWICWRRVCIFYHWLIRHSDDISSSSNLNMLTHYIRKE